MRHALSLHQDRSYRCPDTLARKEDRKKPGSFTLPRRPDRKPAHCASRARSAGTGLSRPAAAALARPFGLGYRRTRPAGSPSACRIHARVASPVANAWVSLSCRHSGNRPVTRIRITGGPRPVTALSGDCRNRCCKPTCPERGRGLRQSQVSGCGHVPDVPRNTAALQVANSANVVGRTPNRSCVWRRTVDSAPLRRSLNSSSRASAK
jgi:hypothetical protein